MEGNRVYIRGIPRDITEKEIREKFEEFGKINTVTIKTGYGFLVWGLLFFLFFFFFFISLCKNNLFFST